MSSSYVSSAVTAGLVKDTLQASPMLSEKQDLRPQSSNNYNSSCYNDDDDEIVWSISSPSVSQSSTASPIHSASSIQPAVRTYTGSGHSAFTTINSPSIESHEGNEVGDYKLIEEHGTREADLIDDFVLVRGDFGAKEWTPPPNLGLGRNQTRTQRKRGHRSTRSDSAVQTGQVLYVTSSRNNVGRRSSSSRRAPQDRGLLQHTGSDVEPVRKRKSETRGQMEVQTWADDVEGLERQIARVSIDSSSAPISISTSDRLPGLSNESPSSCGSTNTNAPHVSQKQKKKSAKSTSHKKVSQRLKTKQSMEAPKLNTPENIISGVDIAARSPPSSPSPNSDRECSASATTTLSELNKKSKRQQKPKQKQTGVTETSDESAKDGKEKVKKVKPKFKPRNSVEPVREAAAPISQNITAPPSTAPSSPRGLGTRSIVDDLSEIGDALTPFSPTTDSSYEAETNRLLEMAYDEAVKFMDAFIQHPDYYTSRASKLTFLQALIVELGLVSSTGPYKALPGSLTAAKAILKSSAFLNVKDYLAVRGQGLDALKGAMRPSRNALVKELRGVGARKHTRAKLGWVKETGLTVLLVSCR